MIKDYDYDISYQSKRANVVANALSRKIAISHLATQQEQLDERFEIVVGRLIRFVYFFEEN